MFYRLRRTLGAVWLTATGAARRARHHLHRGCHGLRILVFHDTPPAGLAGFERFVDDVARRFDIAGPDAVIDLFAGRFTTGGRDRVLFTFDDGFASNFGAAQVLAARGIRGVFFVMPSFVDRSLAEWTAFHRREGREAFPIWSEGTRHGLSRSQLREMVAMGHVVGGHNDAHLDLGRLTDPGAVCGEVDRALDGVADLTGKPCDDFAFAFGRPRHIHPAAVERLASRGVRTYACVRGLNLPGLSPRLLLRDQIDPAEPWIFRRACLTGAIDGLWTQEAAELGRLGGLLPG